MTATDGGVVDDSPQPDEAGGGEELYIHAKEMFHRLTQESPNQSPYHLHCWEIDAFNQ
jgi:hypothetical protein